VQRWRKERPQYRQRSRPQPAAPLQEVCHFSADLFRRNPLITGLIAHLFDCALQDDMERAARRLTIRGLDFLGMTPGAKSPNDYDTKETPPPRAPAPGAGPV